MPEQIWPIYLELSYYLFHAAAWLTLATIALTLLTMSRRGRCRRKIRVVLTFGPVTEQRDTPMIFKMTKTQESLGNTVKFLDSHGDVAPIDGSPTITLSPDGPAVLTVNADGSFDVKGVSVGTCTLQVQADADLGDGVENVLVSQEIEIVAGKAVTGVINMNAPTEQP